MLLLKWINHSKNIKKNKVQFSKKIKLLVVMLLHKVSKYRKCTTVNITYVHIPEEKLNNC